MFQEKAAEATARYFRLSFHLVRILAVDLWTTFGALLVGTIFLFFDEPRVAGIIMVSIAGPLFLAEILFTNWFAKQAAANLGYTLGKDELVVESGVFIRKKAKIPFSRIQDVTRTQGPIERAFGISTLLVQTAGISGPQGPEGKLRGIIDADAMAETIMAEVKRVK
ncbi:MAG: PH domain-containing protein [Thermoplasmatota archaeon]